MDEFWCAQAGREIGRAQCAVRRAHAQYHEGGEPPECGRCENLRQAEAAPAARRETRPGEDGMTKGKKNPKAPKVGRCLVPSCGFEGKLPARGLCWKCYHVFLHGDYNEDDLVRWLRERKASGKTGQAGPCDAGPIKQEETMPRQPRQENESRTVQADADGGAGERIAAETLGDAPAGESAGAGEAGHPERGPDSGQDGFVLDGRVFKPLLKNARPSLVEVRLVRNEFIFSPGAGDAFGLGGYEACMLYTAAGGDVLFKLLRKEQPGSYRLCAANKSPRGRTVSCLAWRGLTGADKDFSCAVTPVAAREDLILAPFGQALAAARKQEVAA
jgi:hypothetical protein